MTWSDKFDAFHEKARAETGLSDFGDTQYHEGMRVLLRALDARKPLDEIDTAAAEHVIVGALTGRLRTEQGWKDHPDALSRKIVRPVIVIGLPRTGTTALHGLLSLDPQFQGIEKWLCAEPMVRPPRESWTEYQQYRDAVAHTDMMYEMAPEVMIAHGVKAEDVDECLVPMAQSFVCNWFASNIDAPDYDRWFRQQDETPSFRRYADVLKLVGKNDDRPWLLKNPSHVFGVEAMLNVFPDACVIQTHRHPRKSMASLINLLDNVVKSVTGRGIDRLYREEREITFWAEGAKRSMAAQDKYPDRFYNVRQGDIRTDPLGVVRGIYSHFGLTLSAEAEAAMLEWAARNPPEGRSAHSYEQVSDEAAVDAAFAEYIDRYNL